MTTPHPDTPELDELLKTLYHCAESNELAVRNGIKVREQYFAFRDIDIAEAKAALTRLLAKRELEGRIDEVETFQWNDPHMYVNIRLAGLREELAKYE
jgi:hypothetical protein